MKRIIDGQTYNTDTATAVARYEYIDDKGFDTEATVFQTRGGAFFIVHTWIENADEEAALKIYFEKSSREAVDRLALPGGLPTGSSLTILNEAALSEPPEAAAEAEPGATVYFRLPQSLKDQIEARAVSAGLSLNSWLLRCAERCAREPVAAE
jgi:hypothetical protein